MNYDEYIEFRNKEFKNLDVVFAENDSDLVKKIGKTNAKNAFKIADGLYVEKDKAAAFYGSMKKIVDALSDEIKTDEDGNGFVKDMFLRELKNNNKDVEKTMMVLGISESGIGSIPQLKMGLSNAINALQ